MTHNKNIAWSQDGSYAKQAERGQSPENKQWWVFFIQKREVFLDVKMFETGQNVKMFLNGFKIALSAAVYEAEVAFSCHNTTITMIIMMMIIDLEMVTVVLIRIDNDWDEPKLRVRRGELQHSRPDGSRSREFDARQVGSDRHMVIIRSS